MIQTSINRYYSLSGIYTAGLDYTITNLPIGIAGPTVEGLINTVYAYINGLGWFSSVPAAVMYEIKSVAVTAINNYTNNKWGDDQPSQKAFIKRMTVPYFIDNGNLDSMKALIANLENDIVKSNLSIEAETPLLLATMIGQSTVDYFTAAISTPGSWTLYFATTKASPERNAIYWSQASMAAALNGAHTSPNGMIQKTNDIVSVNIISALTAAITLAVGTAVFKWTPEVEIKSCAKNESNQISEYKSTLSPQVGVKLTIFMKGSIASVTKEYIAPDPSIGHRIYNTTHLPWENGRISIPEGDEDKYWFIPFGDHAPFLVVEDLCPYCDSSMPSTGCADEDCDFIATGDGKAQDCKCKKFSNSTSNPCIGGTRPCPDGGGSIHETTVGGGVLMRASAVSITETYKSRVGKRYVKYSISRNSNNAYVSWVNIKPDSNLGESIFNTTSIPLQQEENRFSFTPRVGGRYWFIPFDGGTPFAVEEKWCYDCIATGKGCDGAYVCKMRDNSTPERPNQMTCMCGDGSSVSCTFRQYKCPTGGGKGGVEGAIAYGGGIIVEAAKIIQTGQSDSDYEYPSNNYLKENVSC